MPVINWEIIKSQQISIGTLVVCGMALLWMRGWLGDNFVTKAEAAEYNAQVSAQISEVTGQISDNTLLLTALTKEIRVAAIYGRVGTLEAKVYVMERDGANPSFLKEESDRLGRAIEYRDCLLANNRSCDLLYRQIK